MASLLAHTVETTLLRTAQQGVMSAEEDTVIIKTNEKQHVALRGMAARCSQAAALAQKFREEHADLKLINHLVIFYFSICYSLDRLGIDIIALEFAECWLHYRVLKADC